MVVLKQCWKVTEMFIKKMSLQGRFSSVFCLDGSDGVWQTWKERDPHEIFPACSTTVIRLQDLQLQGCGFKSHKLTADSTMTRIFIVV